ncbi:acetyltransferase [Undibacterium sp. Jales W-56]|uniref:acetyltransferase n=1 Tax=Undibacterium sp. Jales W-56 TaxID=2897325 RepID=UPI0021D353F1|nr:acetyltransferase [Undibacterium sp. Jales W-56]MCU6433896.1 acetyltransferase [Undibacterium sp. Jales W-56]
MTALHSDILRLIILGGGGHAKVLHALLQACGHPVVGICDPQLSAEGARLWRGIPVLGGDEALECLDPQVYGLINGVGQMPRQNTRRRLYELWREKGFSFPPLVHPFAWISEDTHLSDGVQVMAGAVLQSECVIGMNTIVNTRASVDHDCRIGAHVHIAPGVTLCGGINVAEHAYIGAGATVIQGISIGSDAIVGAGVTCVRNVKPGSVLLGTAMRLKLTD